MADRWFVTYGVEKVECASAEDQAKLVRIINGMDVESAAVPPGVQSAAVSGPQRIHERYAARIADDLWPKDAPFDETFRAAWKARFAVALREMMEEVRREEQDSKYFKADMYGSGGQEWSLGLALKALAAMEGGSPTYTQGPVENSWAKLCDQCPACGEWVFNPDHNPAVVHKDCPRASGSNASGQVATYRCPRHGTAPAFSKTPFTEADVPYGCPSCGSRLEKV